MSLFRVIHTQHSSRTYPDGPLERTDVVSEESTVFVEADLISQVPGKIANFCKSEDITVIEKIAAQVYK